MEQTQAKLVNLTPHTVDLYLESEDEPITIAPSGKVALVEIYHVDRDPLGDIPVVHTVYGQVLGLPDPEPNTLYIVSSLVAREVMGQRDDILAPDTGPTAKRDSMGRIRGVRRLRSYAYAR